MVYLYDTQEGVTMTGEVIDMNSRKRKTEDTIESLIAEIEAMITERTN
jgi:hypothetical protein